ncbi:hypothetical protein LCGC14_1247910 [marine sediment metagenome]|uniref:Uncharacterized protein n=1 Tax=marine sediment metagenome TaxID=412755 RepID=A0A0F9NL61_9ZZZZ
MAEKRTKFKGLTPDQKKKFRTVMTEYANGTLRSSDGTKVTKRSQAVAIGFSEARRHR